MVAIFSWSICLLALFFLPVSWAEGSEGSEGSEQQAERRELDTVIITGHPLSGEGLSQPVDLLSGRELRQELAANIGDSLQARAGIRSASFGRAVGRPVIHGLGGPRLRMMEDRIGTLDVSVTSTDHAVSIDPFIAERIEIMKGAGALLYGSGAIGGVVDVHTGRIPHSLPPKITGGSQLRYGGNGDRVEWSAKLDGSGGEAASVAWHVDGSLRRSDSYRIPGLGESDRQLRSEGEDPAEQTADGVLGGSDYLFGSGAFGLSWVGEDGFTGVAISGMDAHYGLPGHSHGEAGNPLLDLRQVRVDFESALSLSDFSALNFRGAYNDYAHSEIEPDGVVGTRFANRAWELRSELLHEIAGLKGVIGFQHTGQLHRVEGEEAYVPPVTSLESGIFWVGEYSLPVVEIEAGARFGHVRHDPEADQTADYFVYAASLGGLVAVTERLKLALHLDHSTRAPVAEELYSDGAHLATQGYEKGDSSLRSERAFNLSITGEYTDERVSLLLTGYMIWFLDYIYQQDDGIVLDDLPVRSYRQDDAFFTGVDLSARWEIYRWTGGVLALKPSLDYVYAERGKNGLALPRIPPFRVGVGIELDWQQLEFRLQYQHIFSQHRISEGELPTDSWPDLGLILGYDFRVRGQEVSLFFKGENLTNAEQRPHVSFIKDLAPRPGRTLGLGVSVNFG